MRSGGCSRTVTFPDTWDVRVIRKVGQALAREDVVKALDSPIESPDVIELARGARSAVIIVEDHTRPAHLRGLIGPLLARLNSAGLGDERITVVGATAAHRPMTRGDFVRKLGKEITDRVGVESHDAFSRLRLVATTSRGTPVWLNQTVAAADLKIAVGGTFPHGSVGFGGGAKLLLPGVCGYETIVHNHTRLDQSVSVGGTLDRPMRLDMEEAARMVGLVFFVGYVMDMDLNLCAVRAGDPVATQRALAREAASLYGVPAEPKADLVLACSWPLDLDLFQSVKGFFPAVPFVKRGGVLIWIGSCTEGKGCHRLVESSQAYRDVLTASFKAAAKQAHVVFVTTGVTQETAREVIPSEFEFMTDLNTALSTALSRLNRSGRATILYSSPMTVAVPGRGAA